MTGEIGPSSKNGPTNWQEHERLVTKIPIEERARLLGKEDELKDLKHHAQELENEISRAFRIPSTLNTQNITDLIELPRIKNELIGIAKAARDFSLRYQPTDPKKVGIRVGAVTVALRKNPQPGANLVSIKFNANIKTSPEALKWCAEQYLMDEAEEPSSDIDKILMFIVVANVQADDDSRTKQITLTPCKLCRDRMVSMSKQEHPILPPEVEILTAHEEQPAIQKRFRGVDDLIRFHKEKGAEAQDME